MALTKNIPSNKAKQVRRSASGSQQGVGDDPHMVVGSLGSGTTEYRHRSLVGFNYAGVWADVKRVVKIELAVKVEDDSTHFTYGGKPKVRAERITADWSEGTGGEGNWSAGQYEWPPSAASPFTEVDVTATDESVQFIDVTQVLKLIVPKGVLMPDGTAGGGYTPFGLLLRTPGNELDNNQRAIFYSFDSPTSGNRPYLKLTYDPLNRPPNAPTLSGPATTNNTLADFFEGDHSDPDLDPMNAREIVVWPAGVSTAGSEVWTLPANLLSAGSDEVGTGHFSVPLSLAVASLKLRTAYEWVARTQDPSGAWGPYSARRALMITSSAPTVVASNLTTVAAMAQAMFGGTYSDPENNPLQAFQLQMRSTAAHNDAAFADQNLLLWDTGTELATQAEITAKRIQRHYAGRSVAAGGYTFRIQVQDSTGVWSAWSYDDFTLTTAYSIDPGSVDLVTQVARFAPMRIALYSMGTLRAPGNLIGYIDDPMDLGASAYLNGGGEIYFTLPALHPYCPVIEPHQTHYAVEQWYGDRYRVLSEFSGIITDFDAVADEMVAYGTNYLGLLQTAVDERYNPAKPEENAPTGSHYTNKTIDEVIRDQLTYHKNLPNSPVGFITIPGTGTSFSALAEHVTINSTYSEALPFISGLIDSHKQGTGREARFYARPTDATGLNWQWALVDNWGKDRPNIRLEYGALLNDFRVVALGDFGTRVLGVGQKRGEVQVYRAVGTGGLDESLWGRRAKTRFYPDIIDQNDLQRRVNEEAAQLAKVGKRMALALRADMLTPFDGWDLGDSIVVDIVRGVVDTSRYGSEGLWTVYGVEWRYYPDGHSDMTLTILPKKGLTAPSPDLIPSVNPGVPRQWQTGYGKPTTYGTPPSPTTPPTLLSARLADYEDTWTYRTGFTAPAAGQVKVNAGASQLAVSKTASDGMSRATEFAQLIIGSLLRLRSDNGYERLWRIDGITNSGTYVTLPVTSLASSGSLPSQNSPMLASLLVAGTHTYIPPTPDPVTAHWYADLNTGEVYELDESTGIYTLVYEPSTGGGTAPPTPDTTPPPVPIIRTPLSSQSVQQDDGTTVTIIAGLVGYDAPVAGTLTDLQSIVIESTRYVLPADPTNPDWTLATQWVAASADKTGTLDTSIVQPAVLSATHYWWRAYAVDNSGNKSGASAIAEIDTATDAIGPPPPTGIVVQPGHSVFGVRWDRINADDMAYTEVRWRVSPAGAWISVRVGGTITVITGVVNGTAYNVQLRSVDRSGNTDTGTVDGSGNPIYAKVESNPEAGWVSGGTVTPTAIAGDSLVWDSAMIEEVFAGEIDADWITAGTLRVGNVPVPPPPTSADMKIEVYDSTGNLIGRWGINGIEMFDPVGDPGYKMILDETGLVIYSDYGGPNQAAVVTLSPVGIDAASITFGSARGGHNLIQNSSFELGAFGVTVVTTSTWDVLADWNAGRQGSDTNITVGASALTMTSVT